MNAELNSDYNPESRDALLLMLGKVVGAVEALDGNVATLGGKFDTLEANVTEELKGIRQENSDDHEKVAGLLKEGGKRMTTIETNVGRVMTAVEAEPGGLVDHERRIRDMEPNVWRWVNLRKWIAGIVASIIVAAFAVGLTLLVQKVTAVDKLATSSCQSRLDALDEGKRLKERDDKYYAEQFAALAAGGCTRSTN